MGKNSCFNTQMPKMVKCSPKFTAHKIIVLAGCTHVCVCVVFCRQSKGVVYTLEPGETMFYTWDHPKDKRALRWGLFGLRVKDPRHIFIDKASCSL